MKESLKFTQSGLLALHLQSYITGDFVVPSLMLNSQRRLLGIYKGFSRVDYLELNNLIEMSKNKTVP